VCKHQAKVRSLHKALTDLLKDEDELRMLNLTKLLMNDPDEVDNYRVEQEEVRACVRGLLGHPGGHGCIRAYMIVWHGMEQRPSAHQRLSPLTCPPPSSPYSPG
jgi:hypothetical protein